jgi:hypothetical protein
MCFIDSRRSGIDQRGMIERGPLGGATKKTEMFISGDATPLNEH